VVAPGEMFSAMPRGPRTEFNEMNSLQKQRFVATHVNTALVNKENRSGIDRAGLVHIAYQ